MSATSYTGLGTTINVRAAGTNASVGFNTNVVIVGGYDAANGSATPGEVEYVEDNAAAENLFGADSELATQIKHGTANGAGEIYAVAVSETSTTQSFTTVSEGVIDNAPLFDPTVQSEHEIVVTNDTSGDTLEVTISYEDTLTSPDTGAVINPLTGDIAFEASDDYTVEYDYGDYDSAIQTAAKQNVRFVKVCTEATPVKTTLVSELEAEATDIRFKRGVVGATPNIDSGAISDYAPDADNQRLIEVAPARGDTGAGEARTVGAVGGAYSAMPLGESLTYEGITGFESLNQEYRPSQARDFEGVTAIADTFEIVEGVTTSSEEAFSDVYKCEIVDSAAQALYEVAKDYAGGPNTVDERGDLASDTRMILRGFSNQRPPLLNAADGSSPYSVDVSLGSSDTETILNVGIDPLDVMKEVTVNLNVGTVVTYEGVSA